MIQTYTLKGNRKENVFVNRKRETKKGERGKDEKRKGGRGTSFFKGTFVQSAKPDFVNAILI